MGTGAERIPAGDAPIVSPAGGVAEDALAHELAHALRDDRLSLFYQPIVSLDTGAVLAVEALVRWDHPDEGLLLASRIVPAAARAGLSADLDRWVLDGACRQVSRWVDVRGEAGVPRVSVNLSADRLGDAGLVDEVSESLRRWSVRAGHLVIELRETPLLLTRPAAASLAELRALGVHVLLDDFGTGQASVFAMRRLFLEGFKIDRSFVEQAAPTGRAGIVMDAMQRYAAGMGLDLIVTGVETAEQLDELRALGTRAAQGLLLLGPVPAETLMDVFDVSRPRLTAAGTRFTDAKAPPTSAEATITLSRAAAMLNVSPSTLRRWADDGRLASIRTAGGHRRFRASDVRRLAGPRAARVRTPAVPAGPLPSVSHALATDGADLALAAGRATYEGRSGWFASEDAHVPLREWVHDLALAFAGGSYAELSRQLAGLTRAAERGGTTLAERHAFLERFAGTLRRHLAETEVSMDERAGAARVISVLAHGLLEG